MNTKPAVARFADRATITVQPNTSAKADDEGDSFKFYTISSGHYACESGSNTYIIIDKDGKIGCSCNDMTYRCMGNTVCKHIAAFLKLDSPPQIPASGELIKKLMLMGWVGGKDDLHPAELLKPVQKQATEHYECPKCGEPVDIEADKLQDWKLNHIDVCPGHPDQPESTSKTETVPQSHGLLSGNARILDPEELKTETVDAAPPLPNGDMCCRLQTDMNNDSGKNIGSMADAPMPPSDHSPPMSPDTVPTNLATALCNMQKVDLLAVTDSDNPFFNNAKYADLASVWASIRKPLTDNGLAVIQTTEQYPAGITVVTTLVHVSGETFTSRLSCEVPQSKPDKNGQIKPNVQGLGSTITYLRRYSLAAMVGVAPIDDDGEAAMSR